MVRENIFFFGSKVVFVFMHEPTFAVLLFFVLLHLIKSSDQVELSQGCSKSCALFVYDVYFNFKPTLTEKKLVKNFQKNCKGNETGNVLNSRSWNSSFCFFGGLLSLLCVIVT